MSVELFAAALVEIEGELDWDLLGGCYCHEGGESFFPPEQREAQREAGLAIASELGGALTSACPPPPAGTRLSPIQRGDSCAGCRPLFAAGQLTGWAGNVNT